MLTENLKNLNKNNLNRRRECSEKIVNIWINITWPEEDNVVRMFKKILIIITWLGEDIVIRKFQNIKKNITWLEEDNIRLEKSNKCG